MSIRGMVAQWRERVSHALFGGREYQVQDDGATARLVCTDCGRVVVTGPSGSLDDFDQSPEMAYVQQLLRQNGREVHVAHPRSRNHPKE